MFRPNFTRELNAKVQKSKVIRRNKIRSGIENFVFAENWWMSSKDIFSAIIYIKNSYNFETIISPIYIV